MVRFLVAFGEVIRFEILLAQLYRSLQSDAALMDPIVIGNSHVLFDGGVSSVWSGSNATSVLQVGGSDAASYSTGGRSASQCQQSSNMCDLHTTEL